MAIFNYCLGEAAARHGMDLIAWDTMPNHYHGVVHDPLGRLPAFLEHFHKMLARALNARWGRWENLWSSEQACVTYLATPEAVFEKVCYVLLNPATANLIDRLVDWPGSMSLHYLDGKRTTHERPVGFFRAKGPMPDSVELFVTQPPCSRAIETAETWARRVREAVAEGEQKLREQRLRDNVPVRGRRAVLKTSAFDSPTNQEPRRNLRPAIACPNRERRVEELERLMMFRSRYTEARMQFAIGARNVEFPAGTYRLRAHGVRCEPFPSTALAA